MESRYGFSELMAHLLVVILDVFVEVVSLDVLSIARLNLLKLPQSVIESVVVQNGIIAFFDVFTAFIAVLSRE